MGKQAQRRKETFAKMIGQLVAELAIEPKILLTPPYLPKMWSCPPKAAPFLVLLSLSGARFFPFSGPGDLGAINYYFLSHTSRQ